MVVEEPGKARVPQPAPWGQGEWTSETCTAAARNGHLEMIQWAKFNGCRGT